MWNWLDFKRLDTIKVIMEKLEATATQLDLTDIKNRFEVVEMKTAPIRNDGVVMIWFRNTPIPPFWKRMYRPERTDANWLRSELCLQQYNPCFELSA